MKKKCIFFDFYVLFLRFPAFFRKNWQFSPTEPRKCRKSAVSEFRSCDRAQKKEKKSPKKRAQKSADIAATLPRPQGHAERGTSEAPRNNFPTTLQRGCARMARRPEVRWPQPGLLCNCCVAVSALLCACCVAVFGLALAWRRLVAGLWQTCCILAASLLHPCPILAASLPHPCRVLAPAAWHGRARNERGT